MARLGRYCFMSHHQQDFDETGNPGSGLSVTYITFDGAETEKRIPLRPTESISDTADLNRITNTGYMAPLVTIPEHVANTGRH